MIKQTSNNKLSYILTSYGRIKYFYTTTPEIDKTCIDVPSLEKSTTIHRRREYYLTDHLGNVRVVFCKQLSTNNAILLQQTHYYAHGLEIASLGNTATEHSNLYNGKELQDEAGLDYLNYGWRQLDPQLGVWHCVDKLASSTPNVSPYAYANNNPVNNIDVAGLYSTWAEVYSTIQSLMSLPNGGTADESGNITSFSQDDAASYGGGGYGYAFGGGESGSSYSLKVGYTGKCYRYFSNRNSPLNYFGSILNPKNWFHLDKNDKLDSKGYDDPPQNPYHLPVVNSPLGNQYQDWSPANPDVMNDVKELSSTNYTTRKAKYYWCNTCYAAGASNPGTYIAQYPYAEPLGNVQMRQPNYSFSADFKYPTETNKAILAAITNPFISPNVLISTQIQIWYNGDISGSELSGYLMTTLPIFLKANLNISKIVYIDVSASPNNEDDIPPINFFTIHSIPTGW